jgi:organic hydroperoxide reductase OsmC/OhrA
MSEHRSTLTWKRQSADFTYDSYNREHTWTFDGGTDVRASASPAYKGDPACVDPEEALVAALSSCQMLTFLAIAAKKRFIVDSYTDDAVGFLEKGADGKLALTRIVLRPQIVFRGEKRPSAEELDQMNHAAHDACFIANSLKASVTIEARIES